jgi:hypothetical protein
MIRAFVGNKKIDCFVATESWLTPNHSDEFLSVDGFLPFRDDRSNRSGGGVIVWVRQSFNPSILILSDKPLDIECVAVTLRSSCLLLVACYIPPVPAVSHQSIISHFLITMIDDFLNDYPSFSIIVCGDFNRFNVSDVCKNCNLISGFSGPTYGSAQLDYVLLSEHLSTKYSVHDDMPFDFSSVPHKSLFVMPLNSADSSHKFTITRPFFDLRESFVSTFVSELSTIDWNSLYITDCPLEDKCSSFYSFLFDVFHRTIPVHFVSFSSRDKPWITPLVKHLINCRWKAYHSKHFSVYKHLKAKIHDEIIKAKANWIKKMKSVNIWNVFRTFCGKNSNSPLMFLYSQFSSAKVAADAINSGFSEVFSMSASSHLIPSCPSPVDFSVSPSVIFNMLRRLPCHKSSPDIPCALFRAAAHVLSEPLAYLFNLSLSTHCVPSVLKNSIITPVPKIAVPTVRDLRPISLLPIPMKLLETLVLNRYKSLFVNNYGPDQYGFKPDSSTLCALVRIYDFVTLSLDNSDVCGIQIVSYDFSKAFDKLKFDVIVRRLTDCDFPYPLICWLENFITNRKQCVRIGDSFSDTTDVTSGVPQGSVLGPYIFAVVAGSFLSTDDSCPLVKFADDFTFCFPIYKGSSNSHVNAQHSRLLHWCKEMSLPLNISKCRSLLISFSSNCVSVQLDNVSNVNRLKLLGVTFNSKCSWNDHVDNIVLHASRRLFPLRFIRQSVNKSQLKTLYFSFVRSLLDYCSPLFVGMSKKCVKKLDRVQRRFHRLMCGKYCEDVCLPSLQERRSDLSLRFLAKIMNNRSHCLHNLLPPLLRSGRFQLPTRRTKRYSNSFFLFACKLHNSLYKR